MPLATNRRHTTAIVHDYLTQLGGAERVVAKMLDIWPGAPVYTTLYRPHSTLAVFRTADIRTSWLDRIPVDSGVRALAPLMPAAIRELGVLEHELVVCSSSGWAHGIRTRASTYHVVYCHNPPRWVHEPNVYFASRIKRAASWPLRRALRVWDQRAASRPNLYIANSSCVRDKILRAYGIDAPVVHPPVEVERFTPGSRGSRFLVVSRLLPYKRVDLVVAAATRAGFELDVVGEGPELERLKGMAGPTVSFQGRLPDNEVTELMENCCALCLPGVEDFGITPVEANAAGKPVVAFAGGGALETMVEGRTAVFFSQPTVEATAAAMRQIVDLQFETDVLVANARRFSAERFAERLVQEIERGRNQRLDH